MTCPHDFYLGTCTDKSFCSDEWAEAGCQLEGGPNCHSNGWDCVNWPFNGCWDPGQAQPHYYCYGE